MQDDLKPLSGGRLWLTSVAELPLRTAAWLLSLIGRDRTGTEAVLRGLLLGGRHRWRVGRGIQFQGPANRIRFGRNVCLYGNTLLNVSGQAGAIQLGRNSHVDHFSVLYGQGGLSIGPDCAVAAGVVVYTQTNADGAADGTPVARQPTVYAPVDIGAGCWLGCGARILPGVKLGDGAHVGAGAVITHDVPEYCVVAGVPARFLSSRMREG